MIRSSIGPSIALGESIRNRRPSGEGMIPTPNIASLVERPRLTHAQVRMGLDVDDHHSTCAQKQEPPAVDPYRASPLPPRR